MRILLTSALVFFFAFDCYVGFTIWPDFADKVARFQGFNCEVCVKRIGDNCLLAQIHHGMCYMDVQFLQPCDKLGTGIERTPMDNGLLSGARVRLSSLYEKISYHLTIASRICSIEIASEEKFRRCNSLSKCIVKDYDINSSTGLVVWRSSELPKYSH